MTLALLGGRFWLDPYGQRPVLVEQGALCDRSHAVQAYNTLGGLESDATLIISEPGADCFASIELQEESSGISYLLRPLKGPVKILRGNREIESPCSLYHGDVVLVNKTKLLFRYK